MNLCTRDGCDIVSLSANTSAALTFWLQDASFFEEPMGIYSNTGSNAGVTDLFETKSDFMGTESCEGRPVWHTPLKQQIVYTYTNS